VSFWRKITHKVINRFFAGVGLGAKRLNDLIMAVMQFFGH